MSSIDRALDALNRGIQVADEAEGGRATDFEPAAAPAYQGASGNRGYAPRATETEDLCWRCTKHSPVSKVGLCTGCRAWMACETDADPTADEELGEWETLIGDGHVPAWMRGVARELFEQVNGRPMGPPVAPPVIQGLGIDLLIIDDCPPNTAYILDESVMEQMRQAHDEFYERPDR